MSKEKEVISFENLDLNINDLENIIESLQNNELSEKQLFKLLSNSEKISIKDKTNPHE
ncbi:MAG: hypothetical protein R6U65_03195 [Perlabentimonas sp.]